MGSAKATTSGHAFFSDYVYAGRRALVTGSTGFIGGWVARRLQDAGAQTFLASRSGEALRWSAAEYALKGEHIVADFTVPGTVDRVLNQVRPDVVFNLAGYGVDPVERDPRVAEAVNVRVVEEFVSALHRADSDFPGHRFVQAGSAAEYGPVADEVVESSATAPVSLYGKTKLLATRIVTAAALGGLRAVTARLFTVYGPGEHSHRLLPSLLHAARNGTQLALSRGDQRRDFTYVAEVAEGLIRLGALSGATAPVLNLATGRLTSVREFAECAADVLNLDRRQLRFGEAPCYAEEVQQGQANISLLCATLGWAPSLSVSEGVRKTVEFYSRKHPTRA